VRSFIIIVWANGKNKAHMDKREEVRNILNHLRRGDIGWVKAQDKICNLLDIVGQSEQLCNCDTPLVRTSDKGGEYCGLCEKDLD